MGPRIHANSTKHANDALALPSAAPPGGHRPPGESILCMRLYRSRAIPVPAGVELVHSGRESAEKGSYSERYHDVSERLLRPPIGHDGTKLRLIQMIIFVGVMSSEQRLDLLNPGFALFQVLQSACVLLLRSARSSLDESGGDYIEDAELAEDDVRRAPTPGGKTGMDSRPVDSRPDRQQLANASALGARHLK